MSFDKPPVWEECNKLFKLSGREVWTFGDVVFNPAKLDIPDHLWAHESVHGEQQKHDATVAKLWWMRYIDDQKFRVDQEVEAYQAQYRFICTKLKDRNARYRNLHILATDLCGPMYGRAISYTDAIRRIKE